MSDSELDMKFDVRVFHSVSEVDLLAWNTLGSGKAFQSYRWYQYGEQVMADCQPVYIVLAADNYPIARGTFWLIRNEPLPVPLWVAKLLSPIFYRWPLLICRSPLANSSGLILPNRPLRDAALEAISEAATREACRLHASFVIFDYLNQETFESVKWPAGYSCQAIGDPGSSLEIVWPDFDGYLRSLTPKTRKNYRRYCREAEKRGLTINRHLSPIRLAEAEVLIHNVERRYHEMSNPWQMEMLKNFPMVGGTMFTADVGDNLVGCELLLGDSDGQFVTALGLDYTEPNVYFLLNYADIRHAIESGTHRLHWGSGALEVKRRLGFQIERNDYLVFMGTGRIARLLGRLAARL